ncbi:MAG TPA: helix-turn-helix domain-containing protein [Nocardioides sp.]|nr:helix-turn-helix domain-containing protein [Nocardioides sp.]
MRDGEPGDVREIDDVRALGALAHSDRARLMDALAVHGPSTTTTLARTLGLATGSVSHHLKVLADAGLVAPAPEAATDRRERRWKLVTRGMRWSPSRFRDDATGEATATAAQGVQLARDFERARQFLATAAEPWDEAASSTHVWVRATPAELAELVRQMDELLLSWRRREVPDDGAERQNVRAVAMAFPSDP